MAEEIILVDAAYVDVYTGAPGMGEQYREVELALHNDNNDIPDEIVFGEYYPTGRKLIDINRTVVGTDDEIQVPTGYKFVRQSEPFYCIIKVFFPENTFKMVFKDKNRNEIPNGTLTFYRPGEYAPDYDVSYHYCGVFRYCKTYAYLENDETDSKNQPEVFSHREDTAAHTKDSEVLSAISDQSLVSKIFVNLYSGPSEGSQLINGNLITKDCQLLYLGNLIRDGRSLEVPNPDTAQQRIAEEQALAVLSIGAGAFKHTTEELGEITFGE